MKVLLGECTGKPAKRIEKAGWGRMWVARHRNIEAYPGEPWALDNGAYRDYRSGEAFDGNAYLRCIDKALRVDEPMLFAVVPDIVGGGAESLDFSLGWLEQMPDQWPRYLVVQDGMTLPMVVQAINQFDGVFLGGTKRFKATAAVWISMARSVGVPFHYGRAGTLRALDHAMKIGADSIDSAFPMWTLERWAIFAHWVHHGNPQYDLFSTGENQ